MDGRTVPVEIFSPSADSPWPGLLVIHELFGLNDDIRRIARRFADHGYVAAAGVFYGEIRPREELERACPLVGGYGGKDRIFAPRGRKLIEALNELGKEHDIRMYEDAGHPALAALVRPLMYVEYDEEAAEDSWRRMLRFFSEHLG